MLPKALLYGARAAAHAQGASSASFRNVLQLPTLQSGQIVTGPTVASSSWGPSGSQQFAYQGYTGAGRAITHANSSSRAEDADEVDELNPKSVHPSSRRPGSPRSSALLAQQKRRRHRSGSLTNARPLTTRASGVLDVIRTKQQQQQQQSQPPAPAQIQSRDQVAESSAAPSSPQRRHSTASHHSVGESVPVATEHTLPSDSDSPSSQALYAGISRARNARDRQRILELIQSHGLRQGSPNEHSSSAVYNLALRSLVELQPAGEPVASIIDFYNAMLAADVLPNPSVYQSLISVLITRDAEVRAILATGSVNDRSTHELQNEMNYESAITLFEASAAVASVRFSGSILRRLIEASSSRGDIPSTLRICAIRERDVGPANIATYASLIRAYRYGGDLDGSKEVFTQYLARAQSLTEEADSVEAPPVEIPRTRPCDEMVAAYIQHGHPDLALELLETMIDKGSDTGLPQPSFRTYGTIVSTFCAIGDIESALLWYQKLDHTGVSRALTYPVWQDVFDILLKNNMIVELNEHVAFITKSAEPIFDTLPLATAVTWLQKNVEIVPRLSLADQSRVLTFVASGLQALTPPVISQLRIQEALVSNVWALFEQALAANHLSAATSFFLALVRQPRRPNFFSTHQEFEAAYEVWAEGLAQAAARLIAITASEVSQTSSPDIALRAVLDVATQSPLLSTHIEGLDRTVTSLYANTSEAIASGMDAADWAVVLKAFSDAEGQALQGSVAGPDLSRFVQDVTAQAGRNLINENTLAQLVIALLRTRPAGSVDNIISVYPYVAQQVDTTFSSTPTVTPPPPQSPKIRIDAAHSKHVDQHNSFSRASNSTSALVCFDRYQKGAAKGIFPYPDVISRLINALGRLGEVEKLQQLYADSQWVLAALENDKAAQSQGWFTIEDNMIAALAHAGHLDAANTHRLRILQQGGAPCADSYGALVAAVKSTTDDSSLAQELFEEAERLGVTPNNYLYNTVISKMAKARKTEYALELFHRMPYLGLRPNPVTYAAVIGACCRVGDGDSAVFLFDEMLALPAYRPRVPVYNSMIQFFISQRRDRDRALHYYQLLLDAGLQPTEHTYKLLLDAYGSIEPVDPVRLEATFAEASSRFKPQGPLWASMINAWGSVAHDIERTIAIFEACEASSPQTLPDALVYEAMFNALFANGRVDLVPAYMDRMSTHRVHMTAYIANVLIRGYSAAGDIQRARQIFDTLVDPPLGVAAPHNHFAPQNSLGLLSVPADAPVFREPSSWEAIIGAELRIGQHERAQELMAQLESRMFPLGVTSRIRALFQDEMLAATATAPTPQTL